MKNLPKRKPIRLEGYDYSQNGCYFITICTKKRECLFGDVDDGKMRLNECGEIAELEILKIPDHYIGIEIRYFVVMPNHVHLIVEIGGDNAVGAGAASGAPTHITIGNIVRGYKSGASHSMGYSPWQRNYHDHIIRNDASYLRIAAYIDSNPICWREDRFYQQ